MTKKFRIWDNNQNKYRDSSGELRLSRTFETFCLGLHFQRESLDDGPWVSDLEIEQFTGLLDATGREIYEGDIVEYEPNKPIHRIGQIEWSNYYNGWSIRDKECYPVSDFGVYSLASPFLSFNYVRVVSNIHKNNT